ncbi:DNA-directed RNA polymerase subunit beta [Peribacillus sp. SCS-26]|uniref:DNA-directed RNA polymerase subunit beta n=1 Tax=Paraperibacillus marinus TaxID=3115295 RepID=UPI0039059406
MSVSREEFRKEKVKKEPSGKARGKIRVRLIPIWLRLVIVAFLIAFSAAAGAMVGYSILGSGKPFDVFKKSTWTHIGDLVNKDVR